MFAYIKGTVEEKNNDSIIVEAGGIGYRIFTALSTINNMGQNGTTVKIYTHYYVREDIAVLYGFGTVEELTMFEMLLTVSGVGPKAAISMISTLSPSRFYLAVVSQDTKSLTKAPGIGMKMAQRIILDLKDKISKEQLTSSIPMTSPENNEVTGDSVLSEAVSALMVLGYGSAEASSTISGIYEKGISVEELVKKALKSL
ncbi:Holliday junction branch migration protein RuvA [Ruminiclostridium cellulolyticum]|uniref:Holliday junction branch migration complex subunit RuvA n=1 Tax=Ruminiclostridium cellulolyticum (strain ATCC 35319 / DSM 5812 / JCM 6584 / H10) TaxID=394503 RepID=RUVA_RUMCH|nr:Holliday junction branch migration protein RuvA [Ruminiclostridium cellulolyticum]B8I1A3.1 RecName: Full=Holliday junction branch migration complex subunit RuvA [Ruminiclostridium cellulolyticum H10]ACL75701.1 Holliday junction DNA helicase RuvA [Ruminiclostridium cellulolyticum H10]